MNCGACCIAPSINHPLPKMPEGKPAGVRCAHLQDDNLCELFGNKERPALCGDFKAGIDVCGQNRLDAFALITDLEIIIFKC